MIIKWDADVPAIPVDMEDTKDVAKKVLIGPDDGSQNIIVRLFIVAPGGHTPYHIHNSEHLVQVRAGSGVIVDADGNNIDLSPGQSVFVAPNEKHQFANPSSAEPFEFTCTILNPNKQ